MAVETCIESGQIVRNTAAARLWAKLRDGGDYAEVLIGDLDDTLRAVVDPKAKIVAQIRNTIDTARTTARATGNPRGWVTQTAELTRAELIALFRACGVTDEAQNDNLLPA